MAPTATEFRSSQALLRYSEPGTAVARAVLVVIGAPGSFEGRPSKTSTVQLYLHSFDLALTRFSGKQVSLTEDTDPITREAYSHEVISFGFWPGDQNVREPAFYSYTAPEPEGLTTEHPLSPEGANWLLEGGTALLTYEEVRNSSSPTKTLLEFMESAYQPRRRARDGILRRFGPNRRPGKRRSSGVVTNG